MTDYDVDEARRLLKPNLDADRKEAWLAAAKLLDALATALDSGWNAERGLFLGSKSVEVYAGRRVIVFHDVRGAVGIAAGTGLVDCPELKRLTYSSETNSIVSPDGRDALVVLSSNLLGLLER